MSKHSSQKGSLEISTIAGTLLIAAIVATVSIYTINKYYLKTNPGTPFTLTVPEITPKETPIPPITDETANWKIYTNDAFKYQVKYPQELIAKEWAETITDRGPGGVNNWLLSMVAIGKNTELGDSQISITVSSRTIEEEKEQIKISVANTEGKEENVYVDGVSSFKYTGTGMESASGKIITVLIPNPKKTYNITYTEVKDKTDRTKIFEQILSNFKFIDKKGAFLTNDNEPSGKLFCQSLIHSDFKISSFGYFTNDKKEKFTDCGISRTDATNPGEMRIVGKFINGSWTQIWSGTGNIPQADAVKYDIPNEITK